MAAYRASIRRQRQLHARRPGRSVLGRRAQLRRREKQPFAHKTLGTMGSLGYHRAIAELFGRVKLSGFLAWFLWRTVYWCKLPGLDRKLKVGIDWFLSVLFPPDLVQLRVDQSPGIVHAHFDLHRIS